MQQTGQPGRGFPGGHFFGNGDPETIRMMYKDMQEFITACNNTIRKK